MVLPPGISFFARSWSIWIHCSSQVASAKVLIRSWVISIHSLAPISVPTAALKSLKSLKMRMSDFHLGNAGWNEDFRLGRSQHFGDTDAGLGFLQRHPAIGERDNCHVRHNQIDGPG